VDDNHCTLVSPVLSKDLRALLTCSTARHKSVFDHFWGRKDDLFCLANNDMDLLVPHDVDDEHITAESISPQHGNLPSLVTGFNAEKSLLKCILWTTEEETAHATSYDIDSLSEALTYVLDDLPPALDLWQTSHVTTESSGPSLRSSQYEIQRVNIHATHLWARTLLLDRRIASLTAASPTAGFHRPVIETKEDLCRQMLHLLLTSRVSSLEPNGHVLVGFSASLPCFHKIILLTIHTIGHEN
jgi:hypothetical protein